MEVNLPSHILLILILGAGVIFFSPRQWVLPTILALTVFVSMQFHVRVLELNFYTGRLLLVVAWLRVLARGEQRGLSLVPLDRALLLFCGAVVLVETLRRGLPGLVYASANYFYDAMGTYFLGRILLREAKDLRQVIAALAVICCALAAFMLVERVTRHNVLAALGASVEEVQQRAGKMRCQATFSHPVTAGTYGAVLLPLFVASWWQGRKMRKYALLGAMASTVITVSAGSGGPVMTYAAVVAGLFMWPLRRKMRMVRWVTFLTLLALHLVMKAPVWALIARLSSFTGGSAWHRYNLVDAFVNNIGKWWLLGVDSTEGWGWLTEDVANTYCIVAKHGGLLALVMFIWLLAVGFREVGLRRNEAGTDWPTGFMVWSYGAMLFGHVVTFLGTSYFDQTAVLWHLNLAMIASLALLTQAEREPVQASSSAEESTAEQEGLGAQEFPWPQSLQRGWTSIGLRCRE
jgi:hypothetical protein